MKDVALFAFSTSSSAATIPVTLKTTNQDLGVNQNVASFVVPVGATINMDGTAIMQGLATVFIAQMSGIDLTLFQYMQVVLLAVATSIGTAAVPSAAGAAGSPGQLDKKIPLGFNFEISLALVLHETIVTLQL